MDGLAVVANMPLAIIIRRDFEADFMSASATELHREISLVKNHSIKFCGSECTARFNRLQAVILTFMKYQR
jgi:hypothetical protein